MDAMTVPARIDQYRRLLRDVTDPALIRELRALIAELEMQSAKHKVMAVSTGQNLDRDQAVTTIRPSASA